MKNSVFTFFFMICFAVISVGQTAATTTAYKAGHEGWLVNLDEAQKLSQKTGRPILANFTGSDWCGWCKRLSASVFNQKEFQDWANKNVILLELDFPRGKQIPKEIQGQNASLQQAFGITGYPTVWVFKMKKENNQFNIIPYGKTGYSDTVAKFTSAVEQMITEAKGKGI